MITQTAAHQQEISLSDTLLTAARVELQQCDYREVRQVQCEAIDGVVKLVGSVPTYFHKQVAQSSVQRKLGRRRHIDNQLKVRK